MSTPLNRVPANSRAVCVDIIIRHQGGIVLIKRGHEPFAGYWALPGGFVDQGETVEQAAVREAEEETGLRVRLDKLVGIYSHPERDPHRHTIAICYTAEVISGELQSGDDAADARVVRQMEEARMAFDHAEMCADAGVFAATLEGEGFTDHD